LRGKVKVIVDGVPLTAASAQPIGADGFAQDASWAVTLAKSLVA
jgi:methanogenic corrinoid protein MtbC1